MVWMHSYEGRRNEWEMFERALAVGKGSSQLVLGFLGFGKLVVYIGGHKLISENTRLFPLRD
jgi:hypothetical protein